MRDDFSEMLAEKRDRSRKSRIEFSLRVIKGQIESCMENEMDILPDDFPPVLVEMLAALHKKLEAMGLGGL
jgi:hypothetical protein